VIARRKKKIGSERDIINENIDIILSIKNRFLVSNLFHVVEK